MNFIVFAWITSLLYAASSLVGKFAANHSLKNPWLYNFVWSIVITVISCGIALYYGVHSVLDWKTIYIAGIMSAFTAITYTISLFLLDISILSPLYMLRAPLSAILGYVWFFETLTVYQIGIICVMTIAGMFVTIDERLQLKSFFKKTIAFGLFTVFFVCCIQRKCTHGCRKK